MIKKWLEPVFDHKINMQERIFRLLTVISMMALVFILAVGKSVFNLLVLAGCLAYITVVLKISIAKGRVHAGAAFITALFLVLFPVIFFTAGGLAGGTASWFAFCFVYISLTLHGKRKGVFFLICAAETLLCHYAAFQHPEYVAGHSRNFAYFNSALSTVLVGGLISVMVLFQNRIYEEENEISRRQKKEIEELSQAENHFFSSMSHEIRTPINTILGLNEMILRSDVSDDIAENAMNIQGAGKMLLTLINDILDLSKLRSGKMEIVKVPYDTEVFFSEIINMIWVKAKEKGLEFHLDADSTMPGVLGGDEVRIKQILVNLLNNAVKYTSEGSVTLSVRCERLTADRVRLDYSVTDTGQGVKRENIPFLFDAFKRVDEAKNRHIEGTGLGLSIVKQLVDLMGGEISVNSVYTKGSTFLVTLEQDVVDGRELGAFTLASRKSQGDRTQYKHSFEAPEAHLLIVDDNEMNLKVASKLLSDTKIQIDTASSGAECLRMTQDQHYDVILMDHLMPEMDGVECFHALRGQTAGMCQDVPVIVLTANAGSENQLLYKREGFSGYLAKPVSGTLLEEAVLSILPKELVKMSEGERRFEIGKDVLIFNQKQRRPLVITTDSVCDLPKELTKRFGIAVCPYYVCTDYGRFLDEYELSAEGLLAYLSGGKKARSQAPGVEDYERFFGEQLTGAQNIIHVAMARHSSQGYYNAGEAAKSFENVTVVDSGHLSSSMGLAVLYAARMAENGAGKKEIVETVKKLRNYISSPFVINSTETLCYAGKIPKRVRTLCDALLLHPMIALRRSKISLGGILIGNFAHVTRSYIRNTLKNARGIDKRVLFITYAGMDEQSLLEIQKLVSQYCHFERVYLQKASSAIATNCGPGSFGLLFLKKFE